MNDYSPDKQLVFDEKSEVLFREVQHNRQIVPWVIILVIAVLLITATVIQVILGRPFGNKPAPDIVLIIFTLIFGVALPVFFFTMNLKTEVRRDGLYYRFFPFHLRYRRISPEDLTVLRLRVYSPLAEYGGWGIRFGLRGKAYNVSGNKGVQIDFKTGKSLLIGTSKPNELHNALTRVFGEDIVANNV